jgi:hypothetical protein
MQMVRQVNAAGACSELGVLVRQTRQFFVYDGPHGLQRIFKDYAHLAPCRRCRDYQPPKNDFLERAQQIAQARSQRIAEERARLGLAGKG